MAEDVLKAREEHARQLEEAGAGLFPTWKGRTHQSGDIRRDFDALSGSGEAVTVAGRIRSKRKHGGSQFIDLSDASGNIQVLMRRDAVGKEAYDLSLALDPGDIAAVKGKLIKTAAGEITVDAAEWRLLTKAFAPLPDSWYGLTNVEKRARQRELDLLINERTRETFRSLTRIISALRDFLAGERFEEIETPLLQPIHGGASARPFTTHHNAHDMDLYLRVSPELYHKRLIVGGYERVFEIGKQFRNEGVDRQHNPEFTSCEFYMAFADVEDLIPLSEKLMLALIAAAGKEPVFEYQGKKIDFSSPWKRAPLPELLKKETGIDITKEQDESAYAEFMKSRGIEIPHPANLPALVDTLYKELVRKKAWDPLIVTDFPTYMDPLAKARDDDPRTIQRIQLLAANMEIFKAYTELNDPWEQERRFAAQEAMRQGGDMEAQRVDKAFVEALRIGLPPTAGWGMGIDRVVMLLTDNAHIRDVIAFPLLRPEENA